MEENKAFTCKGCALYAIDGRRMKTREEMHDHLRTRFRLSSQYGNNLDSLWDLLTERKPGTVYFEHSGDMPTELMRPLTHLLQDLIMEGWSVEQTADGNPSRIKAVIFDMDGVMVNSEPRHVRACDAIIKRISNGEYGAEAVHAVGISTEKLYENALEFCGVTGDATALAEEHFERTYKLIEQEIPDPEPSLLMLLDALHASGIRLAVASSSPRDFVEKVLALYGIAPCFELVMTGDDVETLKPDPGIYLAALDRLGLSACEAVAIEDSRIGSIAATDAGIFTIGYVNPDCGKQDLSRADVTVDTFYLVPAALNQM